MGNDNLYLRHITDAVAAIEEYTRGLSREDFLKNRLVQDAVINWKANPPKPRKSYKKT